MKTRSSNLTRLALVLGLAVGLARASDLGAGRPVPGDRPAPGIRVTGEVGATYVIESTTEVEGDFWLTRGWIELTTPTAMWTDPVPTDSPRQGLPGGEGDQAGGADGPEHGVDSAGEVRDGEPGGRARAVRTGKVRRRG